MSATLVVTDKTGVRTVQHPLTIHGEIWVEGEYVGQFQLLDGQMDLTALGQRIEVFIPGWMQWDWWGGR